MMVPSSPDFNDVCHRQHSHDQQLANASTASNSASNLPSSLSADDYKDLAAIDPIFRPDLLAWSRLLQQMANPVGFGSSCWISSLTCDKQRMVLKADRFTPGAAEAEARIFIQSIRPNKDVERSDLSSHIVDFRGVVVLRADTTRCNVAEVLERADADFCWLVNGGKQFDAVFPTGNGPFCGAAVDPVKRRILIGNNFPLILDFALQIAKGLKYLHVVKKVVHHDLQESNVLVFFRHSEHRFHLKLCDFGSALRVGTKMPSPPQNPNRCYDRSSPCLYEYASPSFDVYSFGVVLQHLMSSNISSQQTALERGLRDLQRKCLHHNPAERPKDGGVLVQALRRLSGDDDDNDLEESSETCDEVDEAIEDGIQAILPQPETGFALLSSFRPSRCTPPEYFGTLWDANREPSSFASTLDPAIASMWSETNYAGKYRSKMLPESDENNQLNDGYYAHSASSFWTVSNSITDSKDARFQFLVAQANSSSAESSASQKRIFIEEVNLLRSPFATRFFLGVHDHFPTTPIDEEPDMEMTGCFTSETRAKRISLQKRISKLAVNLTTKNQDDAFADKVNMIFGWQVLSCSEVHDLLRYGPSLLPAFENGGDNDYTIYNKRMDASFFLDAQSALQHAENNNKPGSLVLFLISVCLTRFHFANDPVNPKKNYEVDEIEKYDSSMNGNNDKVIFVNNRLRALPVAVCHGVSMM